MDSKDGQRESQGYQYYQGYQGYYGYELVYHMSHLYMGYMCLLGTIGGTLLDPSRHKHIQTFLADLQKKVRSKQKLPQGMEALKHHSQWLSHYEKHTAGQHIEIPGQYLGTKCPQPDLHVRIVNFGPQVTHISLSLSLSRCICVCDLW